MHCALGRISLFWCCTTSQMRHVMPFRKREDNPLLSTDKCKSEIFFYSTFLVHEHYDVLLNKIQHFLSCRTSSGRRSILHLLSLPLQYASFAAYWQENLANHKGIRKNVLKRPFCGVFFFLNFLTCEEYRQGTSENKSLDLYHYPQALWSPWLKISSAWVTSYEPKSTACWPQCTVCTLEKGKLICFMKALSSQLGLSDEDETRNCYDGWMIYLDISGQKAWALY